MQVELLAIKSPGTTLLRGQFSPPNVAMRRVTLFLLRSAAILVVGALASPTVAADDSPDNRPWLKLIIVYDSTLQGACADRDGFVTTISELARIYNSDETGTKPRPIGEQIKYDDAPTIIDIASPENSSGPGMDPSEVLTRIQSTVIQSPANTALVFWFKNHGFVDQLGQRWLRLGNGNKFRLKRDDLKRAVIDRHCRLTVFLTEACTLSSLKVRVLSYGLEANQIRALVKDLFITPKGS